MKFEELKFKLLEFEKSLNKFIPIAETIKDEGTKCADALEESCEIVETYTQAQMKEISDIDDRLDDLCEKISDMF